MLGSCFLKHLAGSEDFEMYAFDKEEVDITNAKSVTAAFKRISPDFLINCAAYTAVDDCESNKKEAFRVNARAAGVVAEVCKEENATLIHFSTDYVFDGENPEGYSEDDECSPINIYGETKRAGEELIMSTLDEHYIIRTSWLFGEGGKNFVDTMIDLGKTRDELKVVNDQIGSPTYTNDLCKAVIKYFLRPYLAEVPTHHVRSFNTEEEFGERQDFGVYHLTNSETCSWFEFAKEIFGLMNIDVKIDAVDSGEFKRPAKRPHCSVLKNTKLPELRRWHEALEIYLQLNHGLT